MIYQIIFLIVWLLLCVGYAILITHNLPSTHKSHKPYIKKGFSSNQPQKKEDPLPPNSIRIKGDVILTIEITDSLYVPKGTSNCVKIMIKQGRLIQDVKFFERESIDVNTLRVLFEIMDLPDETIEQALDLYESLTKDYADPL